MINNIKDGKLTDVKLYSNFSQNPMVTKTAEYVLIKDGVIIMKLNDGYFKKQIIEKPGSFYRLSFKELYKIVKIKDIK